MTKQKLIPRLIVEDAARAIAFYVDILGAKEIVRFTDHHLDDLIVHAELSLAGETLTLSEQNLEFANAGPRQLNGSPVILHLSVDDADALGDAMVAAGAEVVFPIADQFYGAREGRLRDPFGHLWIISQPLEELSNEEIQRRVDAFHD